MSATRWGVVFVSRLTRGSAGVRGAAPAPALVEQDHPVGAGVERPHHRRHAAAAGAAVDEDQRVCRRVAVLGPPHPLAVADVEHPLASGSAGLGSLTSGSTRRVGDGFQVHPDGEWRRRHRPAERRVPLCGACGSGPPGRRRGAPSRCRCATDRRPAPAPAAGAPGCARSPTGDRGPPPPRTGHRRGRRRRPCAAAARTGVPSSRAVRRRKERAGAAVPRPATGCRSTAPTRRNRYLLVRSAPPTPTLCAPVGRCGVTRRTPATASSPRPRGVGCSPRSRTTTARASRRAVDVDTGTANPGRRRLPRRSARGDRRPGPRAGRGPAVATVDRRGGPPSPTAWSGRLVSRIPETSRPSFFDGLSSMRRRAPRAGRAGRRRGGPPPRRAPPRSTAGRRPYPLSTEKHRPGAAFNDATLGTASVLLAAVWALRKDVPGARDARRPRRRHPPRRGRARADRHELADGLVPLPAHAPWGRCRTGRTASRASPPPGRWPAPSWAARTSSRRRARAPSTSSPWATRPTAASSSPLSIPPADPARVDPISYGWCHGPTGTSMLFLALDRAGVPRSRGSPTTSWYARGRHSVRTSGLPDRLRPGFWDNDGRCCGTAGVGDAFLDAYARAGDPADLAFAVRLGDALVERAVVTDDLRLLAVPGAPRREAATPPGRRLDAGRGRDRRVPVPARSGRRARSGRAAGPADGELVGASTQSR